MLLMRNLCGLSGSWWWKILKWPANFLIKTVTGWIVQPWIVVWTPHTSLKVQSLSLNFLRCQFACIGNPASWSWWWINCALLLPWVEIFDFWSLSWILNPLNNLSHCHEINVVVVFENFIDPIKESFEELRIVFQPRRVIVKTKWSAIRIVVTFKVVVEESVELVAWKSNLAIKFKTKFSNWNTTHRSKCSNTSQS